MRKTHVAGLVAAATSAVIPIQAAGAGSTPTCLGQKATYVGTNGRDEVTVTGPSTVLYLKGGNDVVHVERPQGMVYICGGDGADEVYHFSTTRLRYYGGSGKDKLVYQVPCPGTSGENRVHDVEETLIFPCTSG